MTNNQNYNQYSRSPKRKKNNTVTVLLIIFILTTVAAVAGLTYVTFNKNSSDNAVETAVNTPKKTEKPEPVKPKKTEPPVDLVTEEDEEEPEETEEATKTKKPESKNVLDTMTAAEKKEVNLFLSNFSEVRYGTLPLFTEEEYLSFALNHVMINGPRDTIIYEGDYKKIPASTVDKVLNRFFGETVPHETPSYESDWEYEDGYFKTIAADGDSVAYFTVATNMTDNKNGTYNVDFNVYFNENGPHDAIPKECYSYTDEEASEKYEFYYDGVATVKPKTVNGSETYEIVSYTPYFQ